MDARRNIGSACIGLMLALSPSMVIGQEQAKPGLELPPGAIPGVFDAATGVFSPIDLAAPQASGVVTGKTHIEVEYKVNPSHALLSYETVFCVLRLEFYVAFGNATQGILYHRETKSYNFALGDYELYDNPNIDFTAYEPDPALGERRIATVVTYECTVTESLTGMNHTSKATTEIIGPRVPTEIGSEFSPITPHIAL